MSKEYIEMFVGNIEKNLPNSEEMQEMLRNRLILNVNVKNDEGTTALMNQSKKGSKQAMELILSHETFININDRDKYGNTALMYAVIFHDPDKVKLLLDKGADRNIPNNDNKTPIEVTRQFINNLKLIPPIYEQKKEIIDILERYPMIQVTNKNSEMNDYKNSEMNDYKNKYLKYKNKYLKLKNQLGGSINNCREKSTESGNKSDIESRGELEAEFRCELEKYIDAISMGIEEKKILREEINAYNERIKKELERLDNPLRLALRREREEPTILPPVSLSCEQCGTNLISSNIERYADKTFCSKCRNIYMTPCATCKKKNIRKEHKMEYRRSPIYFCSDDCLHKFRY